MTEPDIFPDLVDDASVSEMRVGQIGTVRGRLDGLSDGSTGFGHGPWMQLQFGDWGTLAIWLPDDAIRTVRQHFQIGDYISVKVQCVDEDANVVALAIWELGAGKVPIPLGELMGKSVA
jgi:hypothetical protein